MFIKTGNASYFQAGAKADAAAAATPWENQVTLRSFLNVAGTEAQDFARRVKYPAMYVINAKDPLAPLGELQRKVCERMGKNAQFKEIAL